jgi:SPP1 gp7 family putative phage head morphogenesis protein
VPTIDVTADVDKYDEAITWLRKRTVMTAAQAHALDDRLKHEAFWVGGGLQIAQVQRVFDSIDEAIEKGESLDDWRKRVRPLLANDAHAETVLRNATQRAYNAGRWQQMNDPETLRLRPWWCFDAVLDSRVTDICKAADGTLLPADHPWWLTNWPPRHHRCRSGVRSLRVREAERRGGEKLPPADKPSAKGFGQAPIRPSDWKPDPTKHHPKLIGELDGKATKGTKARKPRTPKEHKPGHYLASYRAKYGDAAPSLAHGKAALERGLDMSVATVRAKLANIDTPGVKAMLESLQDTDPARSLRSQGGELDPMRKAAAALAGHLDLVRKRPKVTHAALARMKGGPHALDLMSQVTGPSVVHPDDKWRFTAVRRGGTTIAPLKLVEFSQAAGTLEHELGHVIEALNPVLFDRAKAFLNARAKGEKLKTYGKVAGKPVLAWDDQFLHHYTGRKYASPDGRVYGTEITSTALELLVAKEAHWGTLSQLVQKDPEHFLFLLGQLAGP